MSMLTREFFENEAAKSMEILFENVPKVREFHSGEWMNRDYYIRHLKETVLRIRLNNEVDAYALYKIGSKDNGLAAHLAKYLSEEYGHEHMFASDLVRFGVSMEELNKTPVFFATEKLVGYLRLAIDRDGPAPSAIWSWFVEWYSDRYNPIITAKAAEVFGSEYVRGSQTHIDYDVSHDHSDLMFKTVLKAVQGWSDPASAVSYLRHFIDLVGEYFDELYASTVSRSEKQLVLATTNNN